MASWRLGPDGKISAWMLTFVDPDMEEGFLNSNRKHARSSSRVVLIILMVLCGLSVLLSYVDAARSEPSEETDRLRRWQLAIQLACVGAELSSLVASIVLMEYGVIGLRGMEIAAILVGIVSEVHVCASIKHYIARALGYEDPCAAWGADLGGSDGPFVLSLVIIVACAGMLVRWRAFVPIALFSVLVHTSASHILGSPDQRLASTNLLLLVFALLLTGCTKRTSEFQARLLHLVYLEEKQMRFRAEYAMECLKDREDVAVELGSHMGGSSYFGQFLDNPCPDDGSWPPTQGSQGSPPSVPSMVLGAPAHLGRASSESGANDQATLCWGCLPLDASVAVEGRPDPCSLRDLERGQRVLCHDSLSQSVRYAEVLEKQVDVQEVPWVSVGLEDGTQLAMTADHPVQRANHREVVRAADLLPGRDSVVVHTVSTAPVIVKEVARQQEAQGTPGLACLAVRSPDRNLVLVADTGPQEDARSMAVSSGDVSVAAAHVVSTRGIFLYAHSAPQFARARSEPPWPRPA